MILIILEENCRAPNNRICYLDDFERILKTEKNPFDIQIKTNSSLKLNSVTISEELFQLLRKITNHKGILEITKEPKRMCRNAK